MGETSASAEAKEKPAGKSKAAKRQSAEASLNMDELRELAELVNEHGFTDFEFENENIRVRLSKTPAVPFSQQYPPVQISPPAPLPNSNAGTAAEISVTEAAVPAEEELFKITSPIVGTFYRSAGPDKEPYVKEGSEVQTNTIVCIVEAMKLMNEIEAEVSGEVVKIYVENGQPVEYGQPLFGIRK